MAMPHSINGHVRALGEKQAAILRALRLSHPEPACVGTLARVVWPYHDTPPGGWRKTLSTHVYNLRQRMAGTGVTVEAASLHRYALTTESRRARLPAAMREGGGGVPPRATPAAHSHAPRQPGDLGQQHQPGEDHHRGIPERRFCPAASGQSVEGRGVRHGDNMGDRG
jgi:hypothetical protein